MRSYADREELTPFLAYGACCRIPGGPALAERLRTRSAAGARRLVGRMRNDRSCSGASSVVTSPDERVADGDSSGHLGRSVNLHEVERGGGQMQLAGGVVQAAA